MEEGWKVVSCDISMEEERLNLLGPSDPVCQLIYGEFFFSLLLLVMMVMCAGTRRHIVVGAGS